MFERPGDTPDDLNMKRRFKDGYREEQRKRAGRRIYQEIEKRLGEEGKWGRARAVAVSLTSPAISLEARMEQASSPPPSQKEKKKREKNKVPGLPQNFQGTHRRTQRTPFCPSDPPQHMQQQIFLQLS
mmetsp:Transcript_43569/g.85953  ORF Transcript_43569/g.85953 Transcript_43569/m.85953 type:complete len:128 (-) Transcript_43569:247-630(-)